MSSLPPIAHPARPATTFWAPPVAVGILVLLLVLCWPRTPPRERRAASLPEPAAAYVLLPQEGQQSYFLSPERMVWPSGQGLGRNQGALDDLDRAAPRHLPDPAYAQPDMFAVWLPVALGVSNAPPELVGLPEAPPLPTATNGLAVILSPGLRRCGFRFEPPAAVWSNPPATARFHVELDDAGLVTHVLAEPLEQRVALRLLEAALFAGRGASAGRGEVQVSWGR